MKNLLTFILLFIGLNASAQYRGGGNNDLRTQESQPFSDQPGFQKQKLFSGGYINLGFGNRSTNIGLGPQIGYSLTDWLDAGLILNFNYISERDPYSPDKIHQTTFGPGAFMRIFPIDFLFATAQFEQNFITTKFISGTPGSDFKQNINAPSLLLGAGYAGGRMKGSNTYYYLSISFDVIRDKNSPYVDGYNRIIPILRAGYNIGLFQGKSRARKNDYYNPDEN